MFRTLLLTIVFLFVPSMLSAADAEASFNSTFYVSGNLRGVVDWLAANESAVVESTRCEILSRDGDLIRVRKETVKGTFDFTLRERISLGNGEAIYSTKLVESHKGGLVDEQLQVKMTQEGSKVKVVLKSTAKVNQRGIRFIDVSASLSASGRGFEKLLTSKF